MLTDVHTHSTYSYDGEAPLEAMLQKAAALGLAYYGVSEHFNYDVLVDRALPDIPMINQEEYFSGARALQAEYAGKLRVLVGGEFGFSPTPAAQRMYLETIEKYRPDFVVNSVHTLFGADVWYPEAFRGKTRDVMYRAYLERVRESLDAEYDYDIVGHIGYVARNAPYENNLLRYEDFPRLFDDILREIIRRDKILEINSSSRSAGDYLPGEDVLARYYALGGRKVSFASDSHGPDTIIRKRGLVVEALKKAGFDCITVPDRGKHISAPF